MPSWYSTTQTDTLITAAKNRANHTGTQPATTITGLATVATTGNYNDLTNKPATGGGTTSGGGVTIVDNGDGTSTVTATAGSTTTVTDNGDGTTTIV